MIKTSSGLIQRWSSLLFSAYKGQSPKVAARYLLAKLGGGFGENFVGKSLQVAGANVAEIADNSSDVNEANVSNTNLYVFTSNEDATGVNSVTISIDSLYNGSLDLELAGKDAQKAVGGFALSDGVIEIPLVTKDDSYIVDFNISDLQGLQLDPSKARMQFGVAGDIQADITSEILNAPATDAIYIELAEQKYRAVCVVNSVVHTSAWAATMINSGESVHIELAVTKGAYGKQTVTASIAGKGHTGMEVPVGITQGLTLFGRIGHSATYAVADGYKLSCKVKSVSLVNI